MKPGHHHVQTPSQATRGSLTQMFVRSSMTILHKLTLESFGIIIADALGVAILHSSGDIRKDTFPGLDV